MNIEMPRAVVVDDDPIILMDACHILKDFGYITHAAESAEAALIILRHFQGQVGLLFTDVEMPGGLDGFQLATQVAAEWSWIEILVASGRRTPVESDLPAQAEFMCKPFGVEVVREKLARLSAAKAP